MNLRLLLGIEEAIKLYPSRREKNPPDYIMFEFKSEEVWLALFKELSWWRDKFLQWSFYRRGTYLTTGPLFGLFVCLVRFAKYLLQIRH